MILDDDKKIIHLYELTVPGEQNIGIRNREKANVNTCRHICQKINVKWHVLKYQHWDWSLLETMLVWKLHNLMRPRIKLQILKKEYKCICSLLILPFISDKEGTWVIPSSIYYNSFWRKITLNIMKLQLKKSIHSPGTFSIILSWFIYLFSANPLFWRNMLSSCFVSTVY